ncbi:MAG: hypothetical protein K8M05_36960 [Deltaproteobacteria bacterium]|nr:hypothetical protein [Kofleriaceae bacterium]
MKLVEAIEKLSELDDDATICVRRPWTGDSECTVVAFDGKLPEHIEAAGFDYFLEVDIALEVLEVFGDREPTLDQKLQLIIFYAENDAFPDWVHGG